MTSEIVYSNSTGPLIDDIYNQLFNSSYKFYYSKDLFLSDSPLMYHPPLLK